MTVSETLKVCKVLIDFGFSDYEMTCECGYQAMDIYPDYIIEKGQFGKKEINMEGYADDGVKNEDILKIRKAINEVLQC